MNLPKSVEDALVSASITYNPVEETGSDALQAEGGSSFKREPASIARIVFLQGPKGHVQALIPSDALLDLSALEEALGGKCSALDAEAVKAVYASEGMDTLPGIPSLAGFPTIVDEKLLRLPVVYLQSGTAHCLLRLEQGEFKRLLGNVQNLSITIPVGKIGLDPDDPEKDVEQIKAAVHNHTSLKIKELIEQTLEIPPMPSSAQKILDIRSSDEPDMDDLVKVVENDPALAAKVVSYAASPFYGAPGSIKSVQDAIVRVLGFDRVMNISLALAVGQTLKVPKEAPQDELPYWEQSVFCAALMDKLARAMPEDNRPEPGLAYLCGLLHNFGTLILAHVFPENFSLTCRYIEASPHVSHAYIERHLISVTREQLASALLRRWKMPEPVCVAIRNQENPDYDGSHYAYSNLVFLATRLISEWKTGDLASYDVPAALYEQLGVAPEKARKIADEVLEASDELRDVARQMVA